MVISADVEEGTPLAKGSVVTLTISTGTEGVDVPNVSGLSFEDAQKRLRDEGFAVKKTEGYSSNIEKGYIITQSPAGGEKRPWAAR